jgi:tetratricopeptide (TPR) repeat protein
MYWSIGAYVRLHDDYPAAHRAAEDHLSLQPKDVSALNDMAFSYIYGAEPERAISLVAQAINLDPRSPPETLFIFMARARFMLGEYDAAIETCLKSLDINQVYPSCYPILAMA